MTRGREAVVAVAVAIVLAVGLTWPLAAHMGSAGRIDQADGQFSIWNVAWVARTLVIDPLHVFDANIFYPHRWTLAYSENNLGAGALAIPVYWATHQNPYAAQNFVLLLGFVLSATGMYALVKSLLSPPSSLSEHSSASLPASAGSVPGDAARAAAAVSGIVFAFCPYVLAHTAHVQLLMSAGLPWTMLAFHRIARTPSASGGALLGLAMAGEALCCGYYGIFLILMVAYATAVVATVNGWWRNARFWVALVVGGAVAVVFIAPVFIPYVRLQRVEGFSRPLEDARRYSANWQAYLAAAAFLPSRWLPVLGHWNEVLFPGVVGTLFGVAGLALTWLKRERTLFWLYGGLTVLALWASFGPDAGLYSILYHALPLFAWLRAPSRFGLVVVFALAVLAGRAAASLLSRFKRPALAGAILVLATAADVRVPLEFPRADPVSPAYALLASLPVGPVVEMPFYYPQVGLFQHAKYMLASTAHWKPLINGYSDYFPPDFYDDVVLIPPFPDRNGFKALEPNHVKYAVFHMYGYNDQGRQELLQRLKEYESYLRPLYTDDQTRLYEIVGYPPDR